MSFNSPSYQNGRQERERIGKDIKKLEINDIELPQNIIQILNLMPNLRQIDMLNVDIGDNLTKGKLKLHKLKKIKIVMCRP